MKRLFFIGIALMALAGCGGSDNDKSDSGATSTPAAPTTSPTVSGTLTPEKVATALTLKKQGAVYVSPNGCRISKIVVGKADVAAARKKYSNAAVLNPNKDVTLVLAKVTNKCAIEASLRLAALK